MKLKDWVGFLCLILSLIILWQFRQILLLVFTAVVITVALNGLVRYLVRQFNLPRGRAVLLALGLVFVGGLLILGLVLPPFIQQFQDILKLIPVGFQQLVDGVNDFVENPPPWLPPNPDLQLLPNVSTLIQQLGNLSTRAFGGFFTFFSNTAAVLLQLLLIVILTVMMLADPTAYRQLLVRLFPSDYRRRAGEILSKCEAALLSWLGGILITSIFVAIFSFAGLLLLGVQFAFAHAVLAGVFNFIPNIGPTLSLVFPITVALLDSPSKVLAVIILYLIIQNLESYWLSPMMMQRQVSLLPAATLIAQLFFATFLGPLGLILALPLTVVSKTWVEEAWLKDVLDKGTAAARGDSRPT